MGGGHEGHEKFVCPDWKQYKVEGIKELEYVQKKLAEKGLKDPWLRLVIIFCMKKHSIT